MDPTRREISTLVRLAIPVVGTQVLAMTMGAVDTIMLGSVGPHALAAAGLGSHLHLGHAWCWPTAWCAGSIRSSRRRTARATASSAALALQRGVVIAVGVSLPLAVLWLFTEEFLVATGQDPGAGGARPDLRAGADPVHRLPHRLHGAARLSPGPRDHESGALGDGLRERRPHLRQLGADLRTPGRARARRGRRRDRDQPDARARARASDLDDARAAPARGSLAAVEPRGVLARRAARRARARPSGRRAGGPRGLGLPDRDADGRPARRERARGTPDRAQHGLAHLHGAARDRDRRLDPRGQSDRRGARRAGAARRLGRLRARRRRDGALRRRDDRPARPASAGSTPRTRT